MTKSTYQEIYNPSDKQKTYLIKTRPENIKVVFLNNTLHGANVNGINGTFFDTPRPQYTKSCWGLAVNDCKPIGENAHTTDYNGTKRGVVAWNGKEMICRRINNYKEIPDMKWGISGVMLLPDYDRYIEKYFDDIYRKTNHSVIGFDMHYNIYMFVRTDSTMESLVQECLNLGLIGAINLDGGGSSQIRFNNKGYKSSRILNNALIVTE